MRTSTPIIAGLVAAFLLVFFTVRSGSGFLAAEAQVTELEALARAHDLPVASVLALREQALDLDETAFADRVAAFSARRARLGDALAAVSVVSAAARDLARDALARAGDDPQAAWLAVRGEVEAMPGRRFLQMRARYSGRASGRTRD